MTKKIGVFITLICLLIIPTLWVVIYKFKSRVVYHYLPILGDTETIPGDTIPYKIGDFSFVNQEGDSVNLRTFEDQIFIANFFFASCPDICPEMNRNLSYLVEKFEKTPGVKFISHTVHPEHDSVAVLRNYSKRYGFETKKWHFVTGKKSEIYDLAQYDYHAVTTSGDNPVDFIHSEKFFLVDREKRIRGIYESRTHDVYRKVVEDIKMLFKEYKDLEENEREKDF